MCTVKSFVLLVKKMRDTQNAWLDSRKGGNGRGDLRLLMQLKALEKEVDDIIAATDVNYFDRKDAFNKEFITNTELMMASMKVILPKHTIVTGGRQNNDAQQAIKQFNEASARLQYLLSVYHR